MGHDENRAQKMILTSVMNFLLSLTVIPFISADSRGALKMGHRRDQCRPLAPWYEGGGMHVPGLEAGQDGRRVAMRAALGSVKCSSSLKASPAAGCFAYLVALLADTKRTIKVRSCFSLLLAALSSPLRDILSSL